MRITLPNKSAQTFTTIIIEHRGTRNLRGMCIELDLKWNSFAERPDKTFIANALVINCSLRYILNLLLPSLEDRFLAHVSH